MDRPKRKCTMARNDESNSTAPTSKRRRQEDKPNESPDIADGSTKISTKPKGTIEKSTRPFPIETLPTEILVKIIESLPMAQWSDLERVHPLIRDVVYTAWGSLKEIDIQRDLLPRQRIKLDGEEKFHGKRIAIVKKLFERSPNLIDIAIGYPRTVTDGNQRSIMDQLVKFKKLQRIDFGRHFLTTSSLSDFLRESASRDQLKEIVHITASIHVRCPEDHLSVAFDNCNNDKPLRLETIDIAPCFYHVAPETPWNFLAMVDVSRLTTFRVSITDFPQRLLADFLDRTPQLRQLSFDFGCRYMEGGEMHQPAANADESVLDANKRIISAIARMEGLESLIMGSSIFDASACSCGNFDQQLRGLLITLGHRPSFKELGIVGQLAKRAMMIFIARVIPKVESLRLEIGSLTKPLLDAVFLPQSNLRKLHVCSSRYDWPGVDLFNINNYVMQNAPTLESLSLDLRSKIISPDHLKALGGLTELRELKLDSMLTHLDDAVVKSWVDGFGTNLTRLEIRNHGRRVDGDVFLKMIENSPNLNTFIIESCSFTNAILKRMAALSPKIEAFDIGCCSKLTKIGLQHVVDGFRHLKKMTIGRRRDPVLNFDKYRVVNLYERQFFGE